MKLIFTFLVIVFVVGCSPMYVQESDIVDYDGGNLSKKEMKEIRDDKGEPTADIVVLGEEDKVVIVALKKTPYKPIKDEEVVQDRWLINATNTNDRDVCVGIYWKLMDFKFISDYPTEFFLHKKESKAIGVMIQQVWELQGVKFTPEGSGYIYWMGVRDPVEDAKKGDECVHIEDEENITTQ